MKKFLAFLIFGISALAHADTTTPRLKLTLPTIGSPTWGQKINGDMQIIDANVVIGTGTGNFGGGISTITAGSGIIVTNSTGPIVTISAIGGTGTPGGVNSNVQFSSNSIFGGNNGFQYDSSVSSVTLSGKIGLTDQGNTIQIGDGTSNPDIILNNKTGTPAGSLQYQSFGVTKANINLTASDFLIQVSSANGLTASPRVDFPQASPTTRFVRPNASTYIEFSPIGNSTFSIPVVISTLTIKNQIIDSAGSVGTNGQVLTSNGSVDTWQTASGGTGSGGVNSGLSGQAAYYAVNGTTVSGTSNLTIGAASVSLVGNSTVTWDAANSVLNFSTPLKSSGTTTGISFIDRGLIVNNGGYSAAGSSADFIVKGNGNQYGVHYDPVTNIFTSTAPIVTPSSVTALNVIDTSLTPGNCVQAGSGGLLTTAGAPCGSGGSGFSIYPATATTSSPFGASFSTIAVTQTLTGATNAVTIVSTGTGIPVLITYQGNIGSGLQTQKGAVTIGDSLDTHIFSSNLVLVDSTTDPQNGGGIMELWENNANHNDPLIWIHNVGKSSNPYLRTDDDAPDEEIICTSTDNAHGLGKWEPHSVAFQGVDLQINNRAYSNGTFETLAYWHPLSKLDLEPGLYLNPQNVTDDGGIITSSDTSGINFFTLNAHTVGLTAPLNPTASYLFGLPDTVGAAGNMLYNNGNRGKNFNARQWKWTGSDLAYSASTGVSISTLAVVNQISGAGLTNCGDSTHAVSWNSGTNQFGCQAIVGTGGGPTIYSATSTASFPFGFSASTASYTGHVLIGTTTDIGAQVYIVANSTTIPLIIQDPGASPGNFGSADLTDWRNTIGINLSSITADGSFVTTSSVTANYVQTPKVQFASSQAHIDGSGNLISLTANNVTNTQFGNGISFITGADNVVNGRTTAQFATQDFNGQDLFAAHTTPTPTSTQRQEPWAAYSASVNGDGLGLNQSYWGSRVVPGEDAFFGIAAGTNTSCGVSCFENQPSTPVVVVNTSFGSTKYGNVGLGVSTPTATLSVGGFILTSTNTAHPAPTLSSCGTSPSLSVGATDTSGTITVGGGVVASCTLTFGTTKTRAPACTIQSGTAIASATASTTGSALTIGGTSLTSDAIMYICFGNE